MQWMSHTMEGFISRMVVMVLSCPGECIVNPHIIIIIIFIPFPYIITITLYHCYIHFPLLYSWTEWFQSFPYKLFLCLCIDSCSLFNYILLYYSPLQLYYNSLFNCIMHNYSLHSTVSCIILSIFNSYLAVFMLQYSSFLLRQTSILGSNTHTLSTLSIHPSNASLPTNLTSVIVVILTWSLLLFKGTKGIEWVVLEASLFTLLQKTRCRGGRRWERVILVSLNSNLAYLPSFKVDNIDSCIVINTIIYISLWRMEGRQD